MDRQEGEWVTVVDCPIGISCSVLSQTEKSLRLMQYDEGGVLNIFAGYYSFMEVLDLDGDGYEELFYVNYDSLVGYNSAKIWGLSSLYPDGESDGNGQALTEISSVPLYTDITTVQLQEPFVLALFGF